MTFVALKIGRYPKKMRTRAARWWNYTWDLKTYLKCTLYNILKSQSHTPPHTHTHGSRVKTWTNGLKNYWSHLSGIFQSQGFFKCDPGISSTHIIWALVRNAKCDWIYNSGDGVQHSVFINSPGDSDAGSIWMHCSPVPSQFDILGFPHVYKGSIFYPVLSVSPKHRSHSLQVLHATY